MQISKPYHSVPICECGESMMPLPKEIFVLAEPHPYLVAGAPYGKNSPWFLRKSIVDSLFLAQKRLQNFKRGWRLKIVDAYRPLSVQAFMVDLALSENALAMGFDPANLSEPDRAVVESAVFRFWGVPSDNPQTPPPHSTGAAFDCTLVDNEDNEVDMGCPIDELTERAKPDYFASSKDEKGKNAHANRLLLFNILSAEGFIRHLNEWWHFSRGDQLAVWIEGKGDSKACAIYGRSDLRETL